MGELDEDHKLLLTTAFPLLKSRNSGVVVAVASLFHYLGSRSQMENEAVGKALVRVMRNHRGIQFVILNNIASLAATSPDTFRKYLKDFYAVVRAPSAPSWCTGGRCRPPPPPLPLCSPRRPSAATAGRGVARSRVCGAWHA